MLSFAFILWGPFLWVHAQPPLALDLYFTGDWLEVQHRSQVVFRFHCFYYIQETWQAATLLHRMSYSHWLCLVQDRGFLVPHLQLCQGFLRHSLDPFMLQHFNSLTSQSGHLLEDFVHGSGPGRYVLANTSHSPILQFSGCVLGEDRTLVCGPLVWLDLP